MAHITYAEREDSRDTEVFFDHCAVLLGRVPNAMRMAARSPRVAQPLLGFMVAALRAEISGVLDVRTKTLVILKTSMINGCSYCIGHNTALGRSIGFSDEEIADLEGDYRNSTRFTDAEKAAIAWAEYLTERTYRQHKEAIPELKTHFSEEQIVEISIVSGFFNFWNRFVDGLQAELEPETMVGKIRKSRVINKADYVKYMQSCWWGDEGQPD